MPLDAPVTTAMFFSMPPILPYESWVTLGRRVRVDPERIGKIGNGSMVERYVLLPAKGIRRG
ncbi:hypothetical protein GCM10012284_16540 [Mangrovihabitans endophyticus]|uniref:Uncharacterized protein n=1 Tax=Mangrovihabitans endophyticus TaxID=1751298 RepID=A0A8J3BYJ6_9ACTN|nr:hypothetical protein GCM10012284_16540 [Mangrovihabitans endophyticus]